MERRAHYMLSAVLSMAAGTELGQKFGWHQSKLGPLLIHGQAHISCIPHCICICKWCVGCWIIAFWFTFQLVFENRAERTPKQTQQGNEFLFRAQFVVYIHSYITCSTSSIGHCNEVSERPFRSVLNTLFVLNLQRIYVFYTIACVCVCVCNAWFMFQSAYLVAVQNYVWMSIYLSLSFCLSIV